MTTPYKTLTQNISGNLTQLHKTQPNVMKGFADIGKAAMAAGTVDAKTKELIALAVGAVARCDGCIGFHAKALAKQGPVTEEVHEALAMAVYMGGEPVAMYAAYAEATFNEFTSPAKPSTGAPS